MMFLQVGRVLRLSDMIRARAIVAAKCYMRRDFVGLASQLQVIEDLVFALNFALTEEGDGEHGEE